jgi:hypothetical protein
MAYIKQISIKSTPKQMLKYILDINKTNGELVSGINSFTDINGADNMFHIVFNKYYDQRYGDVKWDYTNTQDKTRKYAVKLHHYVQSFKEGTITPELAHKIGEEWAKRCFGEDVVVVIATHIDKGHVHNHFAVGSYTLSGKKIISNKETLNQQRKVSDELCQEYGIDLSIVEKTAENKRLGKKNTYIENNYIRPQGRSWKARIEKNIDELLPTVDTFEELMQGLERLGYTVDTSGKYVKVKPQGKDRFVRLKSLSSGYDEQSLKNKLFEQLKSRVIIDTNYKSTATTKPLEERIEQNSRQRKSEVVQGISKALDENIVSLSGLEQKQSQLKTKLETLDHKVEELSRLVSQYDELKAIEIDYLRLTNTPVSEMTISDTILKQKIDLILMRNNIQDSNGFLSKLHELESAKYNYDVAVKERNNASKEYQRYTKLIEDYHNVKEPSKAKPLSKKKR